jgi:hypothetical protein
MKVFICLHGLKRCVALHGALHFFIAAAMCGIFAFQNAVFAYLIIATRYKNNISVKKVNIN